MLLTKIVSIIKEKNQNISLGQIKGIVNQLYAIAKQELSEGRDFSINGVSTLRLYTRKQRLGVMPSTKERMVIPAKKTLKVLISPKFSKELNK